MNSRWCRNKLAPTSTLDQANLVKRRAKRKADVRDTDPIDLDIDKRTDAERAIQYAQFAKGSFVLLEFPDRPPDKLSTLKDGPYKVVGRDKDIMFLSHASDHNPRMVHISRLSVYRNSKQFSATTAAAKAKAKFLVKAIRNHRPKSKNPDRPFDTSKPKTDIEFEVEWEGYPQTTWERWDALVNNSILHAYVRAHNGAHLLPLSVRRDTTTL